MVPWDIQREVYIRRASVYLDLFVAYFHMHEHTHTHHTHSPHTHSRM